MIALIEKLQSSGFGSLKSLFGYAASLGARGLEAVAKFGLYALAAKVLGGHDSGQFFLCLSVIHFTATASRLGLDKPMTRHVAAELAVGHHEAARKTARQGMGAIILTSLAMATLLAFSAHAAAIDLFHQPELEKALILAAIILPLQNFAYGCAFLLIGMDRGAAAQLVMNALAPALSLIALLLGARDLDQLLVAYSAAYGLCGLLGMTLVMLDWKRVIARPIPAHAKPEPLPTLWASAKPLFVVDMSQAALLSLPILLLGHFAMPSDVSEFSIANRLSMLVSVVVLSIGAIVAPAFARSHRREDWVELRKVNRQAFLLSCCLCLPLLAMMTLGARPLLGLLGSASDQAMTSLYILAFGQLLYCVMPCQDTLLAMTGHGMVLRRLSILQVTLCIVLSFALIPMFGAIGAALASMAIWATGAIGCALLVRRMLPQAVRAV